MSTQSGYSFGSTCSLINERIRSIRAMLSAAEQAATLREKYTEQLSMHKKNAQICAIYLSKTKPLISKTKEYLVTREEESKSRLNNALRVACEIVPNVIPDLHFEFASNSVLIVDKDGCEVQVLEGSGLQQIASVLVRQVILSAAPEYLQTMILDETFAFVNAENSATLSLYLGLISKVVQIISIEQKPQVYANMDYTCYRLSKSEKYTTVERIDYEGV